MSWVWNAVLGESGRTGAAIRWNSSPVDGRSAAQCTSSSEASRDHRAQRIEQARKRAGSPSRAPSTYIKASIVEQYSARGSLRMRYSDGSGAANA